MTTARTEWRAWSSVEALYLGEIIVGRVAATGGGRNGDKPRAIFNLAAVDGGAFWFSCRSVEAAKAELVCARESDIQNTDSQSKSSSWEA